MAFGATSLWEVQTGGSDANAGGFDPGNASMATDGAATSATGSAPVFTSASYNFAATDVGHWVYIKSGTNWTAGWYQITAVGSNAATLSAAAGAGVLVAGNMPYGPTTAAGCATTASPTSATWSVDYSQSTSPYSYADMVIGVTTTQFTSVLKPVGKNLVGNVINVTSGTGFTVQRVQVSSTSTTTATCDKSLGTTGSTLGVGTLGGPLLTPGQAGALQATVLGNSICIKSGTYSITSASTNVAGGCLSLGAGSSTVRAFLQGYGTLRGDNGTKPLLQASSISTFTLVASTTQSHVENISVDGAASTASSGIVNAGRGSITRCKAANCKTVGISGLTAILCETTGCSTGTATFTITAGLFCVAHDNTTTGFSQAAFCVGCVAANNTTGTSDGFILNGTQNANAINCMAYGNARNGFNHVSDTSEAVTYVNCYAENNGVYGFDESTGVASNHWYINCGGYNNTSGPFGPNVTANRKVNFATLTSTAFVNAAGNNFALNGVATGGTLLRAAGIPSGSTTWALPGLSTVAYPDIGAAQHADPTTGGGGIFSSGIIRAG